MTTLVHISDLHLTEEAKIVEHSGRGGPRDRTREVAEAAVAAIISDPDRPHTVLATGDLSDEGTSDQFLLFTALMAQLEMAGIRWLALPGNHDLVLLRTLSGSELNVPLALRSPHRKAAFARHVLERMVAQGDTDFRTVVRTRGSFRSAGVSEVLRELRPMFEHPSWETERRFDELFPILARWNDPRSGLRIGVYLLNSNVRRGLSLLDNAIGRIGRRQLERLHWLSEADPAEVRIAALHHHLAWHPMIGRFQTFPDLGDGLALCEDGREALRVFSSLKFDAVLHGHKHVEFSGTWADLEVRSAASTTLGGRYVGPGLDRVSIVRGRGIRVESNRSETSPGVAAWRKVPRLLTRPVAGMADLVGDSGVGVPIVAAAVIFGIAFTLQHGLPLSYLWLGAREFAIVAAAGALTYVMGATLGRRRLPYAQALKIWCYSSILPRVLYILIWLALNAATDVSRLPRWLMFALQSDLFSISSAYGVVLAACGLRTALSRSHASLVAGGVWAVAATCFVRSPALFSTIALWVQLLARPSGLLGRGG